MAAAATPTARTVVPVESPDTIPEPEPPVPAPGDPAFTSGAKVVRRFDDVALPAIDDEPPRSRAPVVALALVVIASVGGVGVAFHLRGGSTEVATTATPPDAAPPPGDASVPLANAAAATPGPSVPPRRRRPNGTPTTRPRRPLSDRLHSIVVETEPRGGTLQMEDGAYGGSDGTTITRTMGEEITVSCKLPGYFTGRVTLVYDGVTRFAVCRMRRERKCLPGVKNPFDDCPDD
jgi:hypothetical protein